MTLIRPVGRHKGCSYLLSTQVRVGLGRLFEVLAAGAIRQRVAERISFDEVAEAHRRLEAGGLEGKLLMERPEYDLLFRWFVGLGVDQAVGPLDVLEE